MEKLNKQQLLAVSKINGPMLIIAGAGSGKTSVISNRIVNLLKNNVKEKNILALTFTNKAADEMKDRVEKIYEKKLKNLEIMTFHGFGVEFLRKNIEVLPYKKNFSIYDIQDQEILLKNTFREMEIASAEYDLKKLLYMFSNIKSKRIKWIDLKDECDIDFFKNLYIEYNDYLRICNAVDFDDLISLPKKLLQENPKLLEKYSSKIKYLLVDEFQDTSIDQYELIKILSQKNRNICVVGDDDQSIYSWRGANYKNIESFEKDFPERIEIKLEQNYRSTENILSLANSLIQNNKNRKEKKLWSQSEERIPVKIYNLEDEFKEAEFVSNSIRNLYFDANFKYFETAVLTRTNHFMRNIEESFMQNGIPYTISGGFSFFSRSEIKDIVSYLKFIMNPKDDASLLRIINRPRRSIGKATLGEITKKAKKEKKTIFEILSEIEANENADKFISQKAYISVLELLEIQSKFKAKLSSNKNLHITLNMLLSDLDYYFYLEMEYSSKRKNFAKNKRENVKRFIGFLKRYEEDESRETDIYKYLNNITIKVYNKESVEKENKVSILTIHAAKGLEFDTVFIISANEGVIPHSRSIEEENLEYSSIEEERRLFYVAITRAKERLILSYINKRKVMGKDVEFQASSFLNELDKKFISFDQAEEESEENENKDIDKMIERMKNILNEK